jgi:hypothetical protein
VGGSGDVDGRGRGVHQLPIRLNAVSVLIIGWSFPDGQLTGTFLRNNDFAVLLFDASTPCPFV